MTLERAEPAHDWWPNGPPEGHRIQWVEDTDWIVDGETRPCRYVVGPKGQSCKRPSVAALPRGRTKTLWHYCEKHLYGRRFVDDGHVLIPRLFPVHLSSPHISED